MQQSDLKLGIIGLGHVGLPTAVGFAEFGYSVLGTDHTQVVGALRDGEIPFHEPGLQELFDRHTASGMLRLVDDVASVVREATVIFICVGTPQARDGQPDLSHFREAAESVARHLSSEYRVIVEKSTVPVATGDWIQRIIASHGSPSAEFDVASNPEFLREGSAVSDILNPDRIVLGVESRRAAEILQGLYAHLDCPVFVTDRNTAEVIKHASNSFLAMRISYINMISDFCEAAGADVEKVAQGMGLDARIGGEYLQAGLGYGGYCLPKDVRGLIHMGEELGVDFSLLKEVDAVNSARVDRLMSKLTKALPGLRGKKIGVLGLAFKAGTDDIRDSPSLNVIERLCRAGATLRLHDPKAMDNTMAFYPEVSDSVEYAMSPYDAAHETDALLILTAWPEYRDLDMERVGHAMRNPLIVDARNIFDPEALRNLGFDYVSMGRT